MSTPPKNMLQNTLEPYWKSFASRRTVVKLKIFIEVDLNTFSYCIPNNIES